MTRQHFVSWTGFAFLLLAIPLALAYLLLAAVVPGEVLNPEVAYWIVGLFGFLSALSGVLFIRTPQGKVAAAGGLVLILAMLLVMPVTVQTSL